MVTSKLECSLHEDVLPWLFARVDDILLDDALKIQNTFEMVEHGIRAPQYSHHKKLIAIQEKEIKAKADRQKFIKQE
jgi:hypothetical protein